MTVAAKYWLEISIVPADTKLPPIVNKCLGVMSLEAAFYEAKEILEVAEEEHLGNVS